VTLSQIQQLENEQLGNKATKTGWEPEIGGANIFTCRATGLTSGKTRNFCCNPAFVSWFLCCSTAVFRIYAKKPPGAGWSEMFQSCGEGISATDFHGRNTDEENHPCKSLFICGSILHRRSFAGQRGASRGKRRGLRGQ
jgi:hypothetical protein